MFGPGRPSGLETNDGESNLLELPKIVIIRQIWRLQCQQSGDHSVSRRRDAAAVDQSVRSEIQNEWVLLTFWMGREGITTIL